MNAAGTTQPAGTSRRPTCSALGIAAPVVGFGCLCLKPANDPSNMLGAPFVLLVIALAYLTGLAFAIAAVLHREQPRYLVVSAFLMSLSPAALWLQHVIRRM